MEKRKFKGKNDKSCNKKAKLVCWNCNKLGHLKKDCCLRKVNKDGVGPSGSKDLEKQQGHIYVFMQNSKYVLNYIYVISKAFYVQDGDVAWWVDSGATRHICKDLCWFKECQPIEYRSVVKMGIIETKPIKVLGSVLLYFTSGMCLCLNNVLYILGIRKNLMSEIVLNNCGYKQVLESDQYIMSRHGSFIGFGYNWGYREIMRLNEPKRKTLGERGIDCTFIGYIVHSKAYRFYVLESNDYVSVNTIIESRYAIFDEERFTSITRPRDIIQQSFSKNTTQAGDAYGGTSYVSELRNSTRARKAKSFGSDFQLYLVEGTRNETMFQHQYCFIIEEDPKTFNEVMAFRDVHF
uniref:CCHC-type domain-containing protein n=1 Tax=Lactuca sativa TaxID=4236 RepID=A0A9R1V8V3_LACSA|nr:hypothetical protein LSAT_V11C600311740 [Lactuca sativa]